MAETPGKRAREVSSLALFDPRAERTPPRVTWQRPRGSPSGYTSLIDKQMQQMNCDAGAARYCCKMQMTDMQVRLEQAEQNATECQAAFASAEADMRTAQLATQRWQDQSEALKTRMADAAAAARERDFSNRHAIATSKQEVETLKQREKSAQHEALAARQENVQLAADLQQAKASIADLERRIANAGKLRKRETEQREQLMEQQTTVQQEQLDATQQKLDACTKELNELRMAKRELETAVQSSQAGALDTQAVQRHAAQVSEGNKLLRQELDDARAATKRAEQRAAQADRADALEAELRAAQEHATREQVCVTGERQADSRHKARADGAEQEVATLYAAERQDATTAQQLQLLLQAFGFADMDGLRTALQTRQANHDAHDAAITALKDTAARHARAQTKAEDQLDGLKIELQETQRGAAVLTQQLTEMAVQEHAASLQVKHLQEMLKLRDAQDARDGTAMPDNWQSAQQLQTAIQQSRDGANSAFKAAQHAREDAAALHVQLNAARTQLRQAERARDELQQACAVAEEGERRLLQQQQQQHSTRTGRSGHSSNGGQQTSIEEESAMDMLQGQIQSLLAENKQLLEELVASKASTGDAARQDVQAMSSYVLQAECLVLRTQVKAMQERMGSLAKHFSMSMASMKKAVEQLLGWRVIVHRGVGNAACTYEARVQGDTDKAVCAKQQEDSTVVLEVPQWLQAAQPGAVAKYGQGKLTTSALMAHVIVSAHEHGFDGDGA